MSGPASLGNGRGFRLTPPDGSRDPRIDDPTNIWFVHLTGRMLLPLAVRLRIPANTVSVAGLVLGAAGALSLHYWRDWRLAVLGLALCIAWLIADGLDGMIARTTGTTSSLGRALDGMCDHFVFIFLYIALALSIKTQEVWILAAVAGAAHAVQSSLYEAERVRFHRRVAGEPAPVHGPPSRNPLVRLYDAFASSQDRWAQAFDQRLEGHENPKQLREAYDAYAVRALKPMWILSNNMRLISIFIACIVADPRLFWWFELGPLSLVVALGILWLRRIETRLIDDPSNTNGPSRPAPSKISSERSAS